MVPGYVCSVRDPTYHDWYVFLACHSTWLFKARICKLFKDTRNRFQAWRAGTTTLFVVQARQASWFGGIHYLESIPGLHKRLKIRAQRFFDDLWNVIKEKLEA
jgi:hypothetical protein